MAILAREERQSDAHVALQHPLAHVLPDNIRRELAKDDPRRSWIAEAQRCLAAAEKDSRLTTSDMLEELMARFAKPEHRCGRRQRRPRPVPAFFARELAAEAAGTKPAAQN